MQINRKIEIAETKACNETKTNDITTSAPPDSTMNATSSGSEYDISAVINSSHRISETSTFRERAANSEAFNTTAPMVTVNITIPILTFNDTLSNVNYKSSATDGLS